MAVGGNTGGAGGAKNIARAQKKIKLPKVKAPVSDVQSSGASYGVPKARSFNEAQAGKAQAQQYVSQGQAVAKVAAQQQHDQPIAAARRVIHQQDHSNPALLDTLERQKLIRRYSKGGIIYPSTSLAAVEKMGTPGAAPALKILDQTTRPLHAIAGAADAAVTGKPIGPAALRGLQNKDRTTFSTVLKHAGVKGPLANIGGAVLDVGADPTTYLTLGAGSIAGHAAEKAATDTAKAAARAGMSEAGGQTVARAAAKRAATSAPTGKGLTVKLAGKELPGVRRATAATTRAVKLPVAKIAPQAAQALPGKARDLVREVRPLVRPGGVNETEFQGARQAARQSRATVNNAEAKATRLATHLHRTLPTEQHQVVIDAIERNDLSKLPAELARPAHDLRSALKGAERARRRAGVSSGSRVGQNAEYLSSADLKRLRRTVNAEPAVRQRSLVAAQKKAMHAQGRAEIAVKAAPLEAPQALARLERKRADVQFAEQHLQAAKNIPSRGMTETHEQYAKRLVSYARTHDLKLLENRATKLLAAKPTNLAKGYFPRDFEQRALKQLGLTADEAGTRVVRTGTAPSRAVGAITSGFKRSENRVLSTVNPEREAAGKVPFSTNVPLVALNQLKQSAKAVSQGEFAKSMARVGRPIKDTAELRPGEGLYKLGYRGGQFGLHEVKGIPGKPTKGGQYVALNRTLLDEMQGATRQVRAGSQTGRGFDKLTGGWKRLATATPGFHIRNLLGDTQQAYLAAPGQQLPRNIAQAGKAIRRANEQAKSIRPSATDKTLKVAGQRVHIDEFLKGARENGVIDSGYIGRELRDLTGQAAEKATRATKRGTSRAGQTVERWMANRENLMRLATYKAGLDHGMTAAQAADHANLFHVDYGELSDFERKVLRRALPFYTWTARSLPVTAKTLVTKPGKFANIEKVREDVGQASTGQSEDQQRSRMTANQQRQLPFVIKIGKGAQAVSASLPAMLLNELPTGTSTKDLGAYLDELGRFGFQMLNPAFKTPIELRTGVSTYTRQPIENPQRPLVAAPAWVRYLPDQVKRQLEVTPDYVDKRTGKKAWGWRGRADYAYHLIPGAPAQVGQIASGGRPGQPNSPAAALAGALGVRVDSLSDQAAAHAQNTQVYKRLADLNRRAAELNQQGISHDHPTREYTVLRTQINALTAQVSPRKRKARTSDILGQTGPSTDILSHKGGSVDILK